MLALHLEYSTIFSNFADSIQIEKGVAKKQLGLWLLVLAEGLVKRSMVIGKNK
jgi:hypothetical protein